MEQVLAFAAASEQAISAVLLGVGVLAFLGMALCATFAVIGGSRRH